MKLHSSGRAAVSGQIVIDGCRIETVDEHQQVLPDADCQIIDAAKPRLDMVVRNAINNGDFPGPRLLAATREMTPTGNLGDLLVVDGDPLADLSLLQQQNNLRLIMKDGQVYKNTL